MKKLNISKFLILFLSLALFSCSNEDDKYKTFTGPQEALLFNSPTSVLEVVATEPSSIDVLVSSTTISNVDRLIPISISPFTSAAPNQYSVDLSTAIIPAGKNTALVKINSGDYNSLPVSGSVSLVLVFAESNTDYVLPNRIGHAVSIQRGCTDTRADFNIVFDNWASEISWVLTNAAGDVVASSSAYADGLATFNQQFCLTPGVYTFTMNDSYGDGLSSPSNGSFSIRLNSDPSVILASGGGNFGSSTGPISFTITE
jgi:hypothetical protein